MSTPGLIFITPRVKDSAKISDEQFNRFYNEEQLPEVQTFMQQQAGNSHGLALRYKNTIPDSARGAYLFLYPIMQAQWTVSPQQQDMIECTRKSKILEVDDVRDYIDFGFRPYEKIQTFEGYGNASSTGKDRGGTLVAVAMEPAQGEEQDLDDWYRKQHLDMLSMCKGYRRTTRYKRLDDQKPSFLALHEYACRPDELPTEQIKQVSVTEWSKKILAESPMFERDVFELIQVHGISEVKL